MCLVLNVIQYPVYLFFALLEVTTLRPMEYMRIESVPACLRIPVCPYTSITVKFLS